jgi:hypothetical protein
MPKKEAFMNENKKTDNTKQHMPGENLRIQTCKQSIGQAINSAQLPPGVLLMKLNEFNQLLQAQNFQAIETERKAFEEASKKGE